MKIDDSQPLLLAQTTQTT